MLRKMVSACCVLCCLFSANSFADVISIDDIGFGVGALTRDEDQGLDFLDLTFTINQNRSTILSFFAFNPQYQGYRYATEAEVLTLINNFGFSPAATPGVQTVGQPIGVDQLSGLLDMIGATSLSTQRYSLGVTGTLISPAQYRTVMIYDQVDYVDARFTIGDVPGVDIGNFLVKESVASVPEPWTLVLLGVGLTGLVAHRRRAHLSS